MAETGLQKLAVIFRAVRRVLRIEMAETEARKSLQYKVMVDENSHYMDESERRSAGVFVDCETAREVCKRIVNVSLDEQYEPGMSAEKLFRAYKAFGDDPWISSADEGCKFSAWTYAEQRCKEICGAD